MEIGCSKKWRTKFENFAASFSKYCSPCFERFHEWYRSGYVITRHLFIRGLGSPGLSDQQIWQTNATFSQNSPIDPINNLYISSTVEQRKASFATANWTQSLQFTPIEASHLPRSLSFALISQKTWALWRDRRFWFSNFSANDPVLDWPSVLKFTLTRRSLLFIRCLKGQRSLFEV